MTVFLIWSFISWNCDGNCLPQTDVALHQHLSLLLMTSRPSSDETLLAAAFIHQMSLCCLTSPLLSPSPIFWCYIIIYLSHFWLLLLHQMRLWWCLSSFLHQMRLWWHQMRLWWYLTSSVRCGFHQLLLLLLWWMPVFIRWVHHQPCLLHRWWMTSSSVMPTDFLLFYYHPPLVVFQMIEIQNGGSERELSLLIRIPPASMMPDLRSFRHKSLANLSSSLHPSASAVLKNWLLLHQLTLWQRLTSESHHT